MVHHPEGFAPANDKGEPSSLFGAAGPLCGSLTCVCSLLQDLLEIVGALSRLIAEVQEDINHNKDIWNRVFVR